MVTDNLSSPVSHYVAIILFMRIRLHLPLDTADPNNISNITGAKFIVVLLLQAPVPKPLILRHHHTTK